MSDPIKAALRDAETAWKCAVGGTGVPEAIAAFLRALPLHNRWGDRRDYYPDRMADEVERAAKEGSDE